MNMLVTLNYKSIFRCHLSMLFTCERDSNEGCYPFKKIISFMDDLLPVNLLFMQNILPFREELI